MAGRLVTANGPQLHGALASLLRLSKSSKKLPGGHCKKELAATSASLAKQLRSEPSSFRSADVMLLISACCKLSHSDRELLGAVGAHVLRGLAVYPLYALCNVVNAFARLRHRDEQLLEAVGTFIGKSTQGTRLSPVDIASVLYGYARFRYVSSLLMDACTERLQACHEEISGANCATILHSYAQLQECNPELFRVLSRSVLATKPESLELSHLRSLLGSLATCRAQQPALLRRLSRELEQRASALEPQQLAGTIWAMARLRARSEGPLLRRLALRLAEEERLRGSLTLRETSLLLQGLAALGVRSSGGAAACRAMTEELVRRADKGGWGPLETTQLLDALHREPACRQEEAIRLGLLRLLLHLQDFGSLGLAQAGHCLAELELPTGLLDEALPEERRQQGESASQCLMRLLLERLKELQQAKPFTLDERKAAQALVRSYHHRHELDFHLQPQQLKAFCKSLFDVPSSLVSSLARPRQGKRRVAER